MIMSLTSVSVLRRSSRRCRSKTALKQKGVVHAGLIMKTFSFLAPPTVGPFNHFPTLDLFNILGLFSLLHQILWVDCAVCKAHLSLAAVPISDERA